MGRGVQIVSGIFVGALTGVIIGLSISHVVGILVGAITALLSAYFGLKDLGSGVQPRYDVIGFFSGTCLIGIFLGLYMRTHDSLSPSIKDEVKVWTDAGFDSNMARKIVLLEKTGLSIGGRDSSGDGVLLTTKNSSAIVDKLSTILFAAPAGNTGFICDNVQDLASLKSRFELGDSTMRQLVKQICGQTPDTALQLAKLKALRTIICNN
jgi:hypothetical protein